MIDEYDYNDRGYVIRCVDQITGHTIYRGTHGKIAREKDALRPKDTYTEKAAKIARSNLETRFSEEFFSIERLSSFYMDPFYKPDKDAEKKRIFDSIEQAMTRLDELWDGNDFHKGDKMRINQVRTALKEVKTYLLRSEKK